MARTRASKSGAPPPETTQPATVEIGAPGLEIYGGTVSEEFLAELSGGKAAKVFRQMALNDAMVGAILFAVRMWIRQVAWIVQPASKAPEDEEAAEFLRTCMQDMSAAWGEFIDEVLSMLVYGFAPHEIVYKRRAGTDAAMPSRFDDGRIGWARLPIRSQTTIDEWVMDEHAREILGVWQSAPPTWRRVFIPAERMLLFRPTSHKGNPEGQSVLRNAYRAWYFKSKIENFEGIGVERDLAGLPVAWVPARLLNSNASASDKALLATFKKLVTQLRQNEQAGVVMPLEYDANGNKAFDLTLIASGSRRQFDTGAIVNRYDQRIAMTMLADFILIGHEKAGSFALSSSKTDAFALALGAWLDAIRDVLNRQAVPRLFALNPEFKLEQLPTFQHGDVETPDLAELGAYVQALASSGAAIFPDPQLEDHLRRVGGLPLTNPEER